MRARSSGEETIGERLKRLRIERGFSQRELAAPGVSYAYISRIEAGSRQPSVKALRKLAARLGVSPEYLETGSDLDSAEQRELRLADLELAIRLEPPANLETRLTSLLEDALAAGDKPIAARTLLALALVADERGDHTKAVEHFEHACRLERPTALEQVGVFVTIGRAYGAIGLAAQEIRLYEQCIDELTRLDAAATPAMTRYRIRLSYALSDAGQFDQAEQLLKQALKDDADTDDRYMRIRVFWSLARLAEMEGRSKTALRHARRAIALLDESEDRLQWARAHLLAAWIMNSNNDADGAAAQLQQAERILEEDAPSDDLALLKVEQARNHALRGDGAATVTLASEAIELFAGQNESALGTAYWALASGHLLNGQPMLADEAFQRSLELLERNNRWREATEAARAWGQALRDTGRTDDALNLLERATAYANHLPQRQRPSSASPSLSHDTG
jgi:transcriptional regulator with XRE-family HTH domain